MSESVYRQVQAQPGYRNLVKPTTESPARLHSDRWLEEVVRDFSLTDTERRELTSLASEPDPALLGRELLVLAGRWQAAEKLPQALALYQRILSDPAWKGEDFIQLRDAALQRLAAGQGQGKIGARAEVLLRRFAREATDPAVIVPMMLGSAVGALVRTGSLGRLLAAEGAGFWTSGWRARGAAEALGFAAEIPAFTLTGRAMRGFGRGAGDSGSGLARELGSAVLSLGLLKVTGIASQALLSKTGFAPQAASSFFFSQGTQFLGLLAAHSAEVALGWRPSTSREGLILDTLAGLVNLGVGAHLGRSLLGGRWARFQAELELRAQASQAAIPNGESGGQPLLASVGSGSLGRPARSTFTLEKDEGLKPMRMEEFRWRDFQRELEKLRSSPVASNANTRKNLAKLAELTTQESPQYRRQPEWHAYLAMRDFAKLRVLATGLLARLPKTLEDQLACDKEAWEDLLIAHLVVRDYSTVFKLLRHPVVTRFARDDGDETDFENIVFASIPVRNSYAVDYADRKGFTKVYTFDLIPTLHDLISLAQKYDVFVGIARGGLFSASLVDLLGLNNFVMEVHAHGKRKATSRWVDPVPAGHFEGKRILLLDKDTVTGATIQEAMRLLRPFQPAEVGVYLNHGPKEAGRVDFSDPLGEPRLSLRPTMLPSRRTPKTLPPAAARRIQALGVQAHHSSNIAAVPVEFGFYAAHDRLKTALGRLRATKIEFQRNILPSAAETHDPTAAELQNRWNLSLQFHDSLNPLVPGAAHVRDSIVSFLGTSVRDFQAVLEVTPLGESKLPVFSRLNEILGQPRTPEPMAEDFARARYVPWAYRLAQRRGIALEHFPSSYTSAFRTAQEALDRGDYDIALIVGPEAFAYEPIFHDLELPTVSVNIPEADFGGSRSMKKLESLDILRGKRVLVVEDDVRSGATLERLLRGIKSHGPFKELGLFLGLPQAQQLRENIPPDFRKVFISDPQSEQDSVVFLEHFSQREKIFIDEPKP